MKDSGQQNGQTPWYARFFASADSLSLGAFPGEEQSRQEAEDIAKLLGLCEGQVVVDVPCGPGRHLVHWARLGCFCVGIDLSPFMLQLARDRATSEGVAVGLIRGRMEQLPIKSAVADVVTNLFNSFGYLDEASNEKVVIEAARVLKPGGLFLLDTRNPVIQILCAPYGEETALADGRKFVSRAHYDADTKRLWVVWEEVEGKGRYDASIRLYSLAELEAMFERARLEVVNIWGDFQGTKFTSDHYQIILLGRKI